MNKGLLVLRDIVRQANRISRRSLGVGVCENQDRRIRYHHSSSGTLSLSSLISSAEGQRGWRLPGIKDYYYYYRSFSSGGGGGGSELHSRRSKEDSTFLRNHPRYQDLYYHYDPVQLSQDVEHPSVSEFIKLATSSPSKGLWAEEYKGVLDPLLNSLQDLKETELQHVIYHIRLFPNPKGSVERSAFKQVCEPLDTECIQRGVERGRWRAAINFVYADLWSQLILGRGSNFHWVFIKICMRKVDTLTKEKFVRICEQLTRGRTPPKELKIYNVEYNIPRIIQGIGEEGDLTITPQELRAVCAVFYKMKLPLHDDDKPRQILNVLMKHKETISNPSLSGIITGICISKRLHYQEDIYEFLTSFIPQIPRLDPTSCAALLIFAKNNRVRHPQFLEAVGRRLEELKDNFVDFDCHHLDWILQGYHGLDSQDSQVFQTIYSVILNKGRKVQGNMLNKISTEEDSRESEEDEGEESDAEGEEKVKHQIQSTELEDIIGRQYGRRLFTILRSLGYGGIYPVNLIKKALSPEFIKECFGKSMHTCRPETLWVDDIAQRIEGYDGPTLSEKARGFLTKKYMTWLSPSWKKRIPAYELMQQNVLASLQEVLGDPEGECVYTTSIVPIYGSLEIIFCTNPSNEPVKIPPSYLTKEPYLWKTLTSEDLDFEGGRVQYHAILLHNWDKTLWNSDQPIGSQSTLRGRVEGMGYKTHEITYSTWRCKEPSEIPHFISSILHNSGIKLPLNLNINNNNNVATSSCP